VRFNNIVVGAIGEFVATASLLNAIQIAQELIDPANEVVTRATIYPGLFVEMSRVAAGPELAVYTALALGMGGVAIHLLLHSRERILFNTQERNVLSGE